MVSAFYVPTANVRPATLAGLSGVGLRAQGRSPKLGQQALLSARACDTVRGGRGEAATVSTTSLPPATWTPTPSVVLVENVYALSALSAPVWTLCPPGMVLVGGR